MEWWIICKGNVIKASGIARLSKMEVCVFNSFELGAYMHPSCTSPYVGKKIYIFVLCLSLICIIRCKKILQSINRRNRYMFWALMVTIFKPTRIQNFEVPTTMYQRNLHSMEWWPIDFSSLVVGLARTKFGKIFARMSIIILVEEAYAYFKFRCGKLLKNFNHILLV